MANRVGTPCTTIITPPKGAIRRYNSRARKRNASIGAEALRLDQAVARARQHYLDNPEPRRSRLRKS